MKDGSIVVTYAKVVAKRLGWRRADIAALVTQPRKTAYVEDTIRRLAEVSQGHAIR